jgi:hypothetical protein
MSFQSLIVHNGVTHRKSGSETEINQKSNIDSSAAVSEEHTTPKQQLVETIKTNTDIKNKLEASTTIETSEVSNFSTANLVTGLGESIFTLLIASPFLLLGLKKWLHK